ncbi:NAD(P)-binding domain-containing protein [Nocardia lasii]|uniref:NAD(P)-binding domain-containing protein n=1 Tax=Nocardia lasii TaxID=1616107 RepID=A0ABW1JY86_9NOCA
MSSHTAADRHAERVLRHFGPDPAGWVRPGATDHDVVVVGAGQSGLGIGFALRRAGIGRVSVIDAAAPGATGVWTTIARMVNLRTPKNWPEPEFGFPELSFQAWYEAVHGEQSYADLPRVPRAVWAEYIGWIERHTGVPVRHRTSLRGITPAADHLVLTLAVRDEAGVETTVVETTRKVVLANGIEGTGGPYLPAELAGLPEELVAHTGHRIDFDRLAGTSVGVLGAAASAFDTAAAALEAGAAEVHLFTRRSELLIQGPTGGPTPNLGARNNLHRRDDAARWRQKVVTARNGRTVPLESVNRATAFPGFRIHLDAGWLSTAEADGRVLVAAADGTHTFDYVIAGTGFQYDPSTRPELAAIAAEIALWADRYPAPADLTDDVLARTPYVGDGFELQPKRDADWVGRIHVFSAAAHLNFGYPIGDAQSLAHHIPRLIDALARDLFFEDQRVPATPASPATPPPSWREHYAHAIWSRVLGPVQP